MIDERNCEIEAKRLLEVAFVIVPYDAYKFWMFAAVIDDDAEVVVEKVLVAVKVDGEPRVSEPLT